MAMLTDLSSLSSVNVKEKAAEASGGDYSPLPKGKYVCTVEKAELKATNAGDGTYLNVQLRVSQEKHNNRVIFDKLNIQNKSQKTVDIAIQQLSALMLACGFDSIQANPAAVVGKTVLADVGIEPAKGNYDARNKVWGYVATDAQPTSTSSNAGVADADMPFDFCHMAFEMGI